MSKNTTDLRKQLVKMLGYSDYDDMEPREQQTVSDIALGLPALLETLISNREKLARQEGNLAQRLYVALMEIHALNCQTYGVNISAPPTTDDALRELSALRKELDREEPTHE